jgi:hypothetical protein
VITVDGTLNILGLPVGPVRGDNVFTLGGKVGIARAVQPDKSKVLSCVDADKFILNKLLGNPDNSVIPGGVNKFCNTVVIPLHEVKRVELLKSKDISVFGKNPDNPVIPGGVYKYNKLGGNAETCFKEVADLKSNPVSALDSDISKFTNEAGRLSSDVIVGGDFNVITLDGKLYVFNCVNADKSIEVSCVDADNSNLFNPIGIPDNPVIFGGVIKVSKLAGKVGSCIKDVADDKSRLFNNVHCDKSKFVNAAGRLPNDVIVFIGFIVVTLGGKAGILNR